MYRVKQIAGDEDLAGFSAWLDDQGVVHRISEESGEQILWLENPEHTEPVLAALEQYLSRPEVQRAVNRIRHSPVFVRGRWQPSPRHAPMVLAMVVVAGLLAWLTGLGQSELTRWLMIIDPRAFPWDSLDERVSALAATLGSGQFWRLFTPDFLHFSWSHIVFNAVMLWFLGSQVEWFDGRARLLVLFIVTSLGANGLQYLVSGPLFGGLSGVVYGVLGYCWLSQQRYPRFQFPPALVTFAVVWMLIGYTPIPVWLGIGRMANEAHLGGFVAGLLVALVLTPRRSAQ